MKKRNVTDNEARIFGTLKKSCRATIDSSLLLLYALSTNWQFHEIASTEDFNQTNVGEGRNAKYFGTSQEIYKFMHAHAHIHTLIHTHHSHTHIHIYTHTTELSPN